MKIENNIIHVAVAPLSGSITIAVGDPSASPAEQIYDGGSGKYLPDRTEDGKALVLIPTVDYKAGGDGSYAVTNDDIGEMWWLVDSQDITAYPTHGIQYVDGFKDGYAITQAGGTLPKGTLTLSYNVPAGEFHNLSFLCRFVDKRTGRAVTAISDPIPVSTYDKARDNYTLDTEGAPSVTYNAFSDKLSLVEYKQSHGEAVAGSEASAAAASATKYLKTWNLHLRKGTEPLAPGDDYTITYLINDGTGYKVLGTDIAPELTPVTEYDDSHITADLRCMESLALKAEAWAEGRKVDEITFGASRRHPAVSGRYLNHTAVNEADKTRYDRLMVSAGGVAVEHFPRLLKTVWKVARQDTGAESVVGYGSDVRYSLKDDAGMDTAKEGSFSEWAEVEERGAHALATDAGGSVLTDSAGTAYLINS